MRRRHWIAIASALFIAACCWFFLGTGLSVARVGPRPGPGSKVVILLHGYGASGTDFVGLAKEISPSVPEVTFLMPAGPHRAGDGRSWLPDFRGSTREQYLARLSTEMDATLALLWKVIDGARKRGVECRDITIGGFSQGGRVAAQLVASPRDDCALGGAILMSAGGAKDLAMPPAVERPPLRVLVSHGSTDTVVSQREALAAGRYFAASGHLVRLISFNGRHEIPALVREAIPRFVSGETVGEPLPPEL